MTRTLAAALLGALVIPATAQAALPPKPLTLTRANTVFMQARRGFVQYKLQDGNGWDDTRIGAALCRRASRSVVDCRSTITFYESDTLSPDMYTAGEKCDLRIRVRRSNWNERIGRKGDSVDWYTHNLGGGGPDDEVPCEKI